MKSRVPAHIINAAGFVRVNKNGKFELLPTEQLLGQTALRKSNGWLASDVSKFLRCTTFAEFQSLMQQVTKLPQQRLDGMSVKDIVHAIKPRIIDLPHERQAFSEWYFDTTGNSLDDLYVSSTDYKPADESVESSSTGQGAES